MQDALAVINGERTSAVVLGDCLDLMRQLPDNCVSLVMCSPPYEAARTYGIDFKLRGQDWVDWCVERYMECLRICTGLVCWVVEGQTKQFRWSATPALLMADLHRRGVHLRKPPSFCRVGIPGSGGPDWWRNDYEFCVCATSGGKLPWSDNTATGHPPKWAPGGEMSHRLADGARVNQWGPVGGTNRKADGSRENIPDKPRQSHKFLTMTSRGTEGDRKIAGGRRVTRGTANSDTNSEDAYVPPVLANPGNIIRSVPFEKELCVYGIRENKSPREVLRELRTAIEAKDLFGWLARVNNRILGAEVLQQAMQGNIAATSEWSEAGWASASREEDSQKDDGKDLLRQVRSDGSPGGSPHGRGRHEQSTGEPGSSLPLVSPKDAQGLRMFGSGLFSELQGQGILLHALLEVEEIWRSARQAVEPPLEAAARSELIQCKVGGGLMGSQLSHSNEAPYPTKLVEPFVLSFCPPNGIVLDPFSGSGTTCEVAVRLGRRAIGFDIRQSQVDLSNRRLSDIQPDLFGAST